MATVIRMPEVLANAAEAAIQRWLVAVGDTVAIGQPFADIETDKAVVEYAAESEGTVLELLVAEGDSVDVGEPIAVVGAPGETASTTPPAADVVVASAPEASSPAAAPAAAAPAAAMPVAVPDAPAATGRRFISPLVRRLAREHALDLDAVTGTGPNGRIVRADIEPLIARGPAAPVASAPAAPTAQPSADASGFDLVPHSRMRRAIARRLTESKSSIPHFYLVADCRVDKLLALRQELNSVGSVKVSVNDLVVKAAAAAFVDVPEANASWSDDGVLRYRSVDIAVAVALDDGLVTPVVRSVESLSITGVSRSIRDLAERAKAGSLKQHELEGGSFAISNLGMFGTTEFSAIINPPQSGILAVGAARAMPVVVDGAIVVGQVMTVTLSADHRVMDGALAARWLAAFVARIEAPASILA